MINEPPPFQGRNIRIPIVIPMKGKGFLNQGSGLLGNLGAPDNLPEVYQVNYLEVDGVLPVTPID